MAPSEKRFGLKGKILAHKGRKLFTFRVDRCRGAIFPFHKGLGGHVITHTTLNNGQH